MVTVAVAVALAAAVVAATLASRAGVAAGGVAAVVATDEGPGVAVRTAAVGAGVPEAALVAEGVARLFLLPELQAVASSSALSAKATIRFIDPPE